MSSKEPKRKPYKSLDFGAKMKILEEIESGEFSQVEIVKKHGILTSTLSTFMKNKEKIFQASSRKKRGRKPELPEVDEALVLWFAVARNYKININGNILHSKAEDFAKMVGHDDFKASSGWFFNCKKRNELVFKAKIGESGAVD